MLVTLSGITPSDNPSNTAQSSASDPAQTEKPVDEPTQRDFAVGDTIKVGNMEVTVLGHKTHEGGGFLTPDAGNVYYLIDVVIANKGDKAESISSMLMFDLRDGDGFSQSISFGAQSAGQSGLDGSVLPGKVIRGDLGYEIEKNTTGYELQINLNVFGSSGLFSVAMDKISDTPTSPDSLYSTKTGAEIAVSQTYSVGNLEFVVNGIRTDNGKDFLKPDPGNTYFLVDVSVTNTGDETTSISSMLMFTVRDSNGYSYSESMGALSASKGSLDGEVMAGKTLRGELGYEVPNGLTGLELFVNPSVFGTADLFVVSLN